MRRRLLLLIAALCCSYLAIVASDWLPRSSANQQRALALLRQPLDRALGANNGYQAIWFVQQPVPASAMAVQWSADLADLQRADRANQPPTSLPSRLAYPVEEFADLRLCPRAPASCLQQVRDAPDASRQAVASLGAIRERGLALRQSDHLRNPAPVNYFTPLPAVGKLGYAQLMTAAVDFAEGRHDLALDSACQDFSLWRRLRSHTDMLLVDMVGIAYASNLAQLIAEMLAELPVEHALPASCAAALQPLQDGEFDQCDVWRGEFRLIRRLLGDGTRANLASSREDAGSVALLAAPWLINERASLAGLAPHFARLCDAGHDLVVEPGGWIERVFNPLGVVLMASGAPDYNDYARRAGDFATVVQALRTLLWLREQADPQAAFASRPGDLLDQAGSLQLDQATRQLQWSPQSAASGANGHWQWPLAGTRREKPAH